MRRMFALALLPVAALAVAGCSQDYKGLGDAPVGKRHEAPREVIVNPDHFPNIVTGCDGHGHRYYATTRENTTITVITDPSCEHVSAGR